MGTRLYPRTSNPAVLEILACVPKGTSQNRTVVVNSPADVTPQLIQRVAVAVLEERRTNVLMDEDLRIRWQNATVREVYKEVASDLRRDFDYFRYIVDDCLNPEWKQYDRFQTFGWGRIEAPDWFLEDHGLQYGYGGTKDLKVVAELLYHQLEIGYSFTTRVYFDRRSWLGNKDNYKIVTPTGSVYLSELEGLAWG